MIQKPTSHPTLPPIWPCEVVHLEAAGVCAVSDLIVVGDPFREGVEV